MFSWLDIKDFDLLTTTKLEWIDHKLGRIQISLIYPLLVA